MASISSTRNFSRYLFLYLLASQSPLTIAARRQVGQVERTGFARHASAEQGTLGTEHATAVKGTPDKDWPGCKAFTKKGCRQTPGCDYNYIWLDTARQSCRYTDEYKLLPDQIANFFPTEMKRLEEKAIKFANSGCIFGGWWMKCHRRIEQIQRLFNYVQKAHTAVLKDGDSHPAYQLVASDETKARIAEVTKNMGLGFSKHSATKKFCFSEALQKMEQIPSEVEKRKEEATAAGQPLSDDEVANFEKSLQSAAMLTMMCTEVTEDQTQELQAKIEASGALKEVDMEPGDFVAETIKGNQEALKELSSADRDHLMATDYPDVNPGQDPDDHETLVPPPSGLIQLQEEDEDDDEALDVYDPNSLVELEDNATLTGPGKKKKGGPLKRVVKWLWYKGLGWVISRTMWVILFMAGSVFSVVRAGVMFPLMFTGCFLWKALEFLLGDFLYGFLWEGETKFLKTWKDPAKCAPWMWKAVGFKTGEGSVADAASQIVVQPAYFASQATGVWHVYKDIAPPDPCKDVTCGQFAYCSAGSCYCQAGYYPVQDTPDCGQMMTKDGCVCSAFWTGGVFGSKHYGCSASGSCKVDQNHFTYKQCKPKLKLTGFFSKTLNQMATGSSYDSYDGCTWYPTPRNVPKVQTAPKSG